MDERQALARVLAAARSHPLYGRRLAGLDPERATREDLREIEPVTREDWIAHFRAHPEPPPGAGVLHLTPSPALGWMPEYLAPEDLEAQAEALAVHFRTLGLAGRRVLVAFSYHVFAGGWLFHEALVRAGALVFPHGPGEADRIAELGRRFGFDVLVANPSFALKIAAAGGRFELLLAGGEPFTAVPGYRERVEAALGGTALDAYGTSELGIVAAETAAKDGLWEIPGMAILEVLDPETLTPVADGERGELVVTALTRTRTPMIRFRTGDLAIADRSQGRVRLPRGVFGRTDTMVKVKGVKLYPTELAPVLAGFGLEPRGFQVVVESKPGGTDALVLRIRAERVPEGLKAAVERAIGLRIDRLEADPGLEGPPVLDRRFQR